MYCTILVPTDGSEISKVAAQEATELIAADGTLHVLGVIEELPMHKQSGQGAKLDTVDNEVQRTALTDAVEEIEEMADDRDINVVTTMRDGVPHREILGYTNEISADAVVMGKRGQGAATNDILGSTTERVITHAATTVIAVPET